VRSAELLELEAVVGRTLETSLSGGDEEHVGVGVDVADVQRIQSALARWHERFEERFFTADERSYCRETVQAERRYAGLFAAKEAVYKALRLSWDRAFSWRWIEVVHGSNRAPTVVFAQALTKSRPSVARQSVTVSISYWGDAAVAAAVARTRNESTSSHSRTSDS
jgi:holo-[acyl-carrier protein] synthase